MHDSTSETSIYSQDISAFPGVQTSGIFVIEFLLTGSVYCYGFYFPTLSKADSLLHKNELWYPVGFLAFSYITNSWNSIFCQYLIRKRYEFSGISLFVCLLAAGKILVFRLKDYFIKFFVYGCFEGTCVSITLKLLEKSTLKCFQNRQRFAFTSVLGRLLGLFTIPHLLQASITNIGVFYTALLHSVILLNAIPVGFLILKASITDFKLTKHITMTRLNNENNLNMENIDGLWLEDEDEGDKLDYRCISNNGVEILPIIYEDDEENFVCTQKNINNKTISRNKNNIVKNVFSYFTNTLCIILTVTNELTLSLTLFTYLFIISQLSPATSITSRQFLVTLTSSTWIITSLTIYCIVSKMFTKLICFLTGLILLFTSFYFIQHKSYDNRHAVINSLILGIEFGITFSLIEDISAYLRKFGKQIKITFSVKFLCGVILLLVYILTYILYKVYIIVYLSIFQNLLCFNLIFFTLIFIYIHFFDAFPSFKSHIVFIKK